MTTERKELLAKVNELIDKNKRRLLEKLPSVHEVEDGIIIRFFAEWDACGDDGIKYKKIINVDKPEEIVIFYYLPKGAYFELIERDYISCVTCINGCLEIICNGKIRVLEPQTKMCLESNHFEGRALENTYVITTNYK
jgi:hypothetical protein